MSSSPSASIRPSPAIPVRPADLLPAGVRPLDPSSLQESATIKAPLPTQQNGLEGSPESPSGIIQNGRHSAFQPHQMEEEAIGSDSNTPRLPPITNSKSELDHLGGVPADAIEHLDLPGQAADTKTSSSSLPSPSTSSSNLFQEPGSLPRNSLSVRTSGFSEPHHRRSESLNSEEDAPKANKEKLRSVTSPVGSGLVVKRSPNRLQTSRPRSQDLLDYPGMVRMERPEDPRLGQSSDVSEMMSMRRDAFSENRNRSSSRSSSGRVERQIEATLAEAEPSSNARSRKSSHVLGLFKENTSSQPVKKKDGAIQAESVPEVAEEGTRITSVPSDTSNGLASREIHSKDQDQSNFLHTSQNSRSSSSERPASISRPRRTPSDSRSITSEASSEKQDTATGSRFDQGIDQTTEKLEPKQKLPAKLLEEIRGYHNLAAPVHDKFRSTQSKSSIPGNSNKVKDTPRIAKVSGLPSEELDSQSSMQEATSSSLTDDDYDSEKEQISSAMYYPHQAPSPEALQDVDIHEARQAKDKDDDVSVRLPEPAVPTGREIDEASDDVEITLQSRNKSRHLHGDLQKARPPSADTDYTKIPELGASSASESEYESMDETVQPSVRDDSSVSEDPEATPRASPTTRKSFLRSRFQKIRRVPTAPVGAVELKPYNHQVGGHTKVFRFSKRAVCKQLSNRENVFYEEVEHQHPELLKFMPKYVFAPSPRPQSLSALTNCIFSSPDKVEG